MSRNRLLGLGLAAALLGSSTAVPARANTGDVWLTTKAKLTLLVTNGLGNASAVNVVTRNGQVTLRGKVKTEEERAKAEDAIRTLDGVKGVTNLLQVASASGQTAADVTDASIKQAVEAVLAPRPSFKDVKVASVNKGVVLLTGKTPTFNDTLKAVEDTLAVPGVRRVASEIDSGASSS